MIPGALAIAEHVENAGVHSGDATLMIPPQVRTERLHMLCEAFICYMKRSMPRIVVHFCDSSYWLDPYGLGYGQDSGDCKSMRGHVSLFETASLK